ncbi:hypothetical protein RB195_023580 [Necator americanus]|uniref:Reverse transcriptase domain-containing protein n=1 Tax=Necator americanus TaxID=51031 RepID=A0ABR1EJU8_NECAM
MSRVIGVWREYRLSLVVTFVDYEKAFDSVETNAISSALVDQGVDASYVRTLANCYDRCTNKMKLFLRPLTIPIGKEDYDVIGLTETRRRHPLNAVHEEELFLGTCDSRGVGGVGVLANTSMAKNIESFEQLATRIGRLRRKCGPTPALTIFVAYAPTSSYEEEEVEPFYMDLEKDGKEHSLRPWRICQSKDEDECSPEPKWSIEMRMEKIIYDFYSDRFDSRVHLPPHHLREDGHVVREIPSSEIRHATMSVLKQWKTCEAVLLYKKGDLHEISNYRSICLLSVIDKLFTRVILNRIEKVLDEGQPCEQAEFQKGFSTTDHIHTVSKLIEVSREYNMPLCLTFVDIKKALYSVGTESVIEALDNQGVPTQYIKRGVRQGDTISPNIFTATLENAMRKLSRRSETLRHLS